MLYKKNISKSKIVLLKGENGRNLVEMSLKNKNFNISVIECYKKVFKIINNHLEIKKWRSYKINTLIITSGEVLNKLNETIDILNKNEWLFKCKLIVVGNRLHKIAKDIGWKDIITSNYANNEHLLSVIKRCNFYSAKEDLNL
ncbi:uroporphyrinogen-III synthase [Buchnera aphidicola]|uniref:uroporphyrinogen-III synthase n=1 Tax=Buchnera aphidicola TaxID=9 RepID=UPI002905D36F|nr:uroporphyrinogen-III synthase [Buchnera aphidicola]